MWEVVSPHEPLDVAEILDLEGYPVVLERRVDALAEVLAGQPGEGARRPPVAMAVPGVVHAVHEVRHPARVGLDAHHAKLRVPLEDATEDEHAQDVLAAADDGHKGVELGPAGLQIIRAAGQDVKG